MRDRMATVVFATLPHRVTPHSVAVAHVGVRAARGTAGKHQTIVRKVEDIGEAAGGGLDINLVDQRGNVNIGAFRRLEREAVASPGAFYFCNWIYAAGRSQTPSAVRQRLIRVRPQAGLRSLNANAFDIRIVVHPN